MERSSKRLTDLSPGKKRLIILRMFCNEQLQEYCESLGLRRDDVSIDTFNTLIGVEVVEALIWGLQEGLAQGVKKIMDQRLESADTVDRWVKNE